MSCEELHPMGDENRRMTNRPVAILELSGEDINLWYGTHHLSGLILAELRVGFVIREGQRSIRLDDS